MDRSGNVGIIAVCFLFVITFIIYIVYSIFSGPVATIVDEAGAVDADNTVPAHIQTNLETFNAIWPIILVIIAVLAAVWYVYRHETGRGYNRGF